MYKPTINFGIQRKQQQLWCIVITVMQFNLVVQQAGPVINQDKGLAVHGSCTTDWFRRLMEDYTSGMGQSPHSAAPLQMSGTMADWLAMDSYKHIIRMSRSRLSGYADWLTMDIYPGTVRLCNRLAGECVGVESRLSACAMSWLVYRYASGWNSGCRVVQWACGF